MISRTTRVFSLVPDKSALLTHVLEDLPPRLESNEKGSTAELLGGVIRGLPLSAVNPESYGSLRQFTLMSSQVKGQTRPQGTRCAATRKLYRVLHGGLIKQGVEPPEFVEKIMNYGTSSVVPPEAEGDGTPDLSAAELDLKDEDLVTPPSLWEAQNQQDIYWKAILADFSELGDLRPYICVYESALHGKVVLMATVRGKSQGGKRAYCSSKIGATGEQEVILKHQKSLVPSIDFSDDRGREVDIRVRPYVENSHGKCWVHVEGQSDIFEFFFVLRDGQIVQVTEAETKALAEPPVVPNKPPQGTFDF